MFADANVHFGSKTDFDLRSRHVRFTANSGHSSVQLECPKSANSGHWRPGQVIPPLNSLRALLSQPLCQEVGIMRRAFAGDLLDVSAWKGDLLGARKHRAHAKPLNYPISRSRERYCGVLRAAGANEVTRATVALASSLRRAT
jgi:hypothetical protein